MLKNKTERRRDDADNQKLAALRAANRSLKKSSILMEIICVCIVTYACHVTASARGKATTVEYLAPIAVLLTVAIITVLNLSWHRKDERNKLNEKKAEEARKQFPFAFLNELKQPAAIFDERGNVSWGNDEFIELAPKDILMYSGNYNFSAVFSPNGFVYGEDDTDAVKALAPDPGKNNVFETLQFMSDHQIGLSAKGINPFISDPDTEASRSTPERRIGFAGDWLLHAYRHEVTTYTKNNNTVYPKTVTYFLVVMTDETDLKASLKHYYDDTPLCAYLVIDNLTELNSRDQGPYRIVSAKVDGVVKKWANELEAIIKEYERDKYILLFRRELLETQLNTDFPILKELQSSEISGSDDFRITASIGISKPSGTLLEKEHSAQTALKTAQNRGGNQAIVYSSDTEYKSYGAKEDYQPQSHSGVHTRLFADKLLTELRRPETQNVIIMGHKYPDFDSIGSCVGMVRLALSYGKKVSVVMPNPVPPAIAEAVNRLREITEYDSIFTVPDICMNSMDPNTMLICCDVNNFNQFEKPELVQLTEKLFIIDHHRTNEFTPTLSPELSERVKYNFLIIPSASSASELVSEILEHALPSGCKLEAEEADAMFAGLLLDTKQFTKNTQPTTFSAALYLRNNGADPTRAQALFETELNDYRAEAHFGTDVFLERESIAIACEESSDSSPTKRIAAAKTADRLLNVKKIRASFAVARMGSDVFISARSDGSINVQLIMEGLGGGGHYNAAATQMKAIDVDEAITRLCLEIRRYFGEYDATQPPSKAVMKEIGAIVNERRKRRSAAQAAQSAQNTQTPLATIPRPASGDAPKTY